MENKMAKILIITWNFPPTVGGIENLIAEIHTTLKKQHDVTVITAGVHPGEDEPGVVRVPSSNVLLFMFKSFFVSLKLLVREKYDLILAGSLLINPIAIVCGAIYRTPVISMSYGLDIIYSNPLYQLFIRSVWNRAMAIVAISENSRELLLERGVKPDKPFLIHPGLSRKFVERIDEATSPEKIREEYGIGRRPCLVSVGRLTKRKGIYPFVTECMPRILENVPDCVLLIVGDDPSQALVHKEGEMSLVREAVIEKGLEDHVIFSGKISDADLMGVYGAGDLFVFPVIEVPNDVEGFGMVAIEAAVFGKPSVASRIGGIPDAVEDGVAGILVEPGDYDAFARSVVRLLKDDGLRTELGHRAKARTLSQFNWDVLGERWDNLIENVLDLGARRVQ